MRIKDANRSFTNYSDWKEERKLNSEQIKLFACLQQRENSKIHVVIDIDTHPDSSALAKTIKSLADQILRPFSYTVVSKFCAPDQISTLGMPWYSADSNPLISYISTLEDVWIIVLRPGDILNEHAILFIAETIIRRPEVSAISFDDSFISQEENETPRFKPNFNIDLLRSVDYINRSIALRTSAFCCAGAFSEVEEVAVIYDALLSIYDYYGSEAFTHLPSSLLTYKTSEETDLFLPYKEQAVALLRHFNRRKEVISIVPGLRDRTCRIVRSVVGNPKVSIIIPTRDQIHLLRRCIESIFEKTAYDNFEVIIVDNGSLLPESVAYLSGLPGICSNIRVIQHPYPFNFSEMNNRAAGMADGEYLLFLNNDTAALHSDWLEVLLAHAQRPEVGLVGARLIHDNGTIQHAGVVVGLSNLADHPWFSSPASDNGPLMRLQVEQNYSAVTAACMLVKKSLFFDVGGFDASDLQVLFNDVDLSLNIRQVGKLVVWTPFATLIHDGSASLKDKRIEPIQQAAKMARTLKEIKVMQDRWLSQLADDPYFSRNYSLTDRTVGLNDHPTMTWNALPWRPIPRIHGAPADFDGCGDYRILSPLNALHRSGKAVGYASTRLYNRIELARSEADILIVQRQFSSHQLEALHTYRKNKNLFIVCDVDDLLTDIPYGNPYRAQFQKLNINKALVEALSCCNRLVVSTPQLADAYSKHTDECRVVPNRLSGHRWLHLSRPRRLHNRPRVGWAGGNSHRPDLLMFENVLRSLHDEVEWVFLGGCPKGLRKYLSEYHPGVGIEEYPEKLASLDLDLAVAPLQMNAFNEAKSNIKILEYGVLNIPVICTDIAPYQGDFPVTRVTNRDTAWIGAIREHLSDPIELARRGEILGSYVRSQWILENHLEEWLSAWTR